LSFFRIWFVSEFFSSDVICFSSFFISFSTGVIFAVIGIAIRSITVNEIAYARTNFGNLLHISEVGTFSPGLLSIFVVHIMASMKVHILMKISALSQ